MIPTICYLWFNQGKNKWGITPMSPADNHKHIYKESVVLSRAFADAFTINNGKSFGLPVDHALVCCIDI